MSLIYVSSYGKDDLKGIYIVDFDENQHFHLIKQIHTKDYPSYIIKEGNTIFASYKNASANNDGGGIGSFDIVDSDLVLKNKYGSSGRSYTHLCVDDQHKYVFAANYHVGATASYALENDEVIKKIGSVRHKGSGPDILKRQTSPHAHYVGITPDKKYVFSIDLGADRIVMYSYNDGKLEEMAPQTFHVTPGNGPRHIVFSKDGQYAYLSNEIANELNVLKYEDGMFSLIQTFRTTPRHFNGFSAAAAIRLTEDGEHLFISNRGHDSIAMYRVNKDNGKVALLSMCHCGKEPRDFNIINDEYLIIGAQKSNALQLMRFDKENETLTLLDETLELPEPVCICI